MYNLAGGRGALIGCQVMNTAPGSLTDSTTTGRLTATQKLDDYSYVRFIIMDLSYKSKKQDTAQHNG